MPSPIIVRASKFILILWSCTRPRKSEQLKKSINFSFLRQERLTVSLLHTCLHCPSSFRVFFVLTYLLILASCYSLFLAACLFCYEFQKRVRTLYHSVHIRCRWYRSCCSFYCSLTSSSFTRFYRRIFPSFHHLYDLSLVSVTKRSWNWKRNNVKQQARAFEKSKNGMRTRGEKQMHK